ncbi:hypothetical protein [Azospirillum argentinense]
MVAASPRSTPSGGRRSGDVSGGRPSLTALPTEAARNGGRVNPWTFRVATS